MTTALHSRSITAFTPDQADTMLNIVVDELQHLARQERRCGILVTKQGPGQFAVELREDVPYGVTLEART
ncbi:hypothetical protein ACMX2H_03420 [Arthrobacter sulfonylureivorans]|uniref:hypothetical protein n=1 Tax=Arthrobacter sulfonylureivorans TaxID=2486855 RepID=UPI0039E4B5A9